jgi:uncharacterized protein with ParB-like and HNH nuclease domain
MEVSKSAFQTPITIKEVVENIHRKRYLLPVIQREVVWDEDQIVRLFDSIMREYTIGSFLFWLINKETVGKYQFYEFVRDYHERDNPHNQKASLTGEESITGILDGQQRFTALYIGLRGTYAYKVPWKRWDSDQAFPRRRLYLNLLLEAEPNDLGMKFNFRFLTEDEARANNGDTYWFQVGRILDFKKHSEINNHLIENGLMQLPKEKAEFANETLFKLFYVIHEERLINYYLETSQELDKVLNIFIRINSGGTPLSYSDLLLSIASAQWKTKDAREEITNFVDGINSNGEFSFDKDFVLKSCLVLSDLDVAFKVDNFNSENTGKIEKKWEDITKAIRLATDLVLGFGYNFQTLVSTNAVIPIAYYIMKIGNPDNFVESERYNVDRTKIQKWLTASLLKRTFSGTPDNVLRAIREIMGNPMTTFPLDEIVEHFKGKDKTLLFTDDDIDNLLNYEYGKSYTFMALSLLYPTFDFRNKFHQDHIHPRKHFRKPELRKRGITDSDLDFYQENMNKLGNLQLLEGVPNEEKAAKELDKWLESKLTTELEKRDFRRRHYIPDTSLDFSNFREFMKARNELMKKKFREILPMAKESSLLSDSSASASGQQQIVGNGK